MRRNKCIFFIIFLAISLLVSCTESDKTKIISIQDYRNNPCVLIGEQIPIPGEHIYAIQYFVANDSLLLIHNQENDQEDILKIYDLASQNLINSFFPYGRGPGELLSVHTNLYGHTLCVICTVTSQYAAIDLSSPSLETYLPTLHQHTTTASMIPFDETSFVADNMYYFEDEKSGIKNNQSEQLLFLKKEDTRNIFEKLGKAEYNTSAVAGGGKIIANKKKNIVIYAERFRPFIQLYDANLAPVKTLAINDNLDVQYTVLEKYGRLVVSHENPMAFSAAAHTDDYFYLAYNGTFRDKNKRLNEYASWIFKFDWKGNLIKTYQYAQYIENLSLSAREEVFYITSYNDDDHPILVKLYPKIPIS